MRDPKLYVVPSLLCLFVFYFSTLLGLCCRGRASPHDDQDGSAILIEPVPDGTHSRLNLEMDGDVPQCFQRFARYSFMRRNVRRLTREVNGGNKLPPTVAPEPAPARAPASTTSSSARAKNEMAR